MRVRIATIVTFGLLSTLAACSSSSTTGPKVIYDGGGIESPGAVVLHTAYSGFSAPEHFTVRDSSHWANVWATAFAFQAPIPPLPAIDFTSEMVVGAALGVRPTGGYDVTIERVMVESDEATVIVAETVAGNGCGTTQAVTEPVMLVKVATIEGPVRFQQRTRTRTCG
jgi:hypothetical protein